MEILEYVVNEALVMIPVLLTLGWVIKKTDLIINNLIPFVLLVVGVGFTPWLLGGFTPENIAQGVLVTGAAVLSHQLYKQAQEIKENE